MRFDQRCLAQRCVDAVLATPLSEQLSSDCLPGEALPPICEACYCPVLLEADPLGYQVSRTWPGTPGLPVFFHKPCYRRATARARSWPRARNS